MALGANFKFNLPERGASDKGVPAGTLYRDFFISRMNAAFHNLPFVYVYREPTPVNRYNLKRGVGI